MLLSTAYTDVVTLLTCLLTKCILLKFSVPPFGIDAAHECRVARSHELGTTAVAAKVAVDSGFPFVRMISADDMIRYSDSSKSQIIQKVFLDSYKSPLLLIFIDDIERIIEYVPIGLLQTLLVLLKKVPPDQGRRFCG